MHQQQQQQQRSQQRAENRERLRRFYDKVNPAKVKDIEDLLDQFAGSEDELFSALEEKYGVSTQLGGRMTAAQQQQQQQQQPHNARQNEQVQQQQQRLLQGAFGNTQAILSEQQAQQVENSRAPKPILPESVTMTRFATEILPQMQRTLTQVQEAYGKLAESIAVANSRGVDVAKSAGWVVSAQLGAANFIASAKQFVQMAADEEQRMHDIHATLESAANVVSSATGVVRATSSSGAAATKVNLAPGALGSANQLEQMKRETMDLSRKNVATPLGAAAQRSTRGNRVVFDVAPLGGERHVISDLIHSHASSGDLIILHPGVYYENLVLRNDIEIRVASTAGGGAASAAASLSSPDGSRNQQATIAQSANLSSNDPSQRVTLLPADSSMPTLQIVGDGTRCLVSGVHFCKLDRQGNPLVDAAAFTQDGHAHQDGVPHISITGSGKLKLDNCTVTSGGGGVVCVSQSELSANLCLFRGCAFAGVYAKDVSFVEMVDCRIADCEVGVRIRDATLSMLRSEVVRSVTDGVVLHGAAKSEMDRAVISESGGSGLLLSSACELALTDSRLLNNGKWGVDATRGANFAVVRGMLVKNLLGPMSRQPTR